MDEQYQQLKKQYDEYVEYSKDLETELEAAVIELEKRLEQKNKEATEANRKIDQLESKLTLASRDCSRQADIIAGLKSSLEDSSVTTRNLEQQNDELLDRVRILEQTEFDLNVRLERGEEEKIVLMCELEELHEKSGESENELRMKAELTELQAELARMECELVLARSQQEHPQKSHTPQKRKETRDHYHSLETDNDGAVSPPVRNGDDDDSDRSPPDNHHFDLIMNGKADSTQLNDCDDGDGSVEDIKDGSRKLCVDWWRAFIPCGRR